MNSTEVYVPRFMKASDGHPCMTIAVTIEPMRATCPALEGEIEHTRTHLIQSVLEEAFAP